MPISICHESTHPAGAQKQLNIHETLPGAAGTTGKTNVIYTSGDYYGDLIVILVGFTLW